MYFCAALEHRKLPLRCTSSTLSQSSSVLLNERLSRKSPALLTRMSTRPKRLWISANALSTCCALDTSHAIAMASVPAASTASTASLPASAPRPGTAPAAPLGAPAAAGAAAALGPGRRAVLPRLPASPRRGVEHRDVGALLGQPYSLGRA